MPWTLTQRNELDTATLATFSNTDTTLAIIGEPLVTLGEWGEPQIMTFRVKNTVAQFNYWQIVTYVEDGEQIFWGVVGQAPSLESQGAGPADKGDEAELTEVVVYGGYELLRASVAKYAFYDRALTDPFFASYHLQAFYACEFYAHPALTLTLSNFVTGTGIASVSYKPMQNLWDVLNDLANTVNYKTYVDRVGAVHFRPL